MHRSSLIRSAVARRAVSAPPLDPPFQENALAHVKGLYLLCAVMLCERLASVMVFSLLVLYLNENLGMSEGWSAKAAGYLFGLSYAAGVLGGLLADRGLGARHDALAGLALLAAGYSVQSLTPSGSGSLWISGACFIAGTGLFKPNCTTLVGGLYLRSDRRRGIAFRWLYYAVNVGSLIGPCLGGLVRNSLGWIVAFRLATFGIAVSFGLLAIGQRCLSNCPTFSDSTSSVASRTAASNGSRVRVLALVLAVLVMFGAALSQSYGTLLLWARDDARRIILGYVIPPDWFAALPTGFVLILGPLMVKYEKVFLSREHLPTDAGRLTAGMMMCGLSYAVMLTGSLFHHGPAPASPLWLIVCKAALALGEILGVPVGLALAETLAQFRFKGLTLGLSYGALAAGYWLGGEVSALWPVWSHARFFGALSLGCFVAAALIQSQARQLTQALADRS